jgi:hypothetical protein
MFRPALQIGPSPKSQQVADRIIFEFARYWPAMLSGQVREVLRIEPAT